MHTPILLNVERRCPGKLSEFCINHSTGNWCLCATITQVSSIVSDFFLMEVQTAIHFYYSLTNSKLYQGCRLAEVAKAFFVRGNFVRKGLVALCG